MNDKVQSKLVRLFSTNIISLVKNLHPEPDFTREEHILEPAISTTSPKNKNLGNALAYFASTSKKFCNVDTPLLVSKPKSRMSNYNEDNVFYFEEKQQQFD